MGSMGGGFGGGMQKPQSSSDSNTSKDFSAEKPSDESAGRESDNSSNARPQMSGNFGGMPPEFSNGENGAEQDGQMQRPEGSFSDRGQSLSQPQSMISASSLVTIGICILVLGAGIVFALKFKRRK